MPRVRRTGAGVAISTLMGLSPKKKDMLKGNASEETHEEKSARLQKYYDSNKEEMKFLSLQILPPSQPQPHLEVKERKLTGHSAAGGMIMGASCMGNSSADDHVATVIAKCRALVREIQAIDVQMHHTKHTTSHTDSGKALQKLQRRRNAVMAKLERRVQTIQVTDKQGSLIVDRNTIGVVLWATFGAPGYDVSDVTGTIEARVKNGGIDDMVVSCESFNMPSNSTGGSARVLSIIYLGKPSKIANKVSLGLQWTPRVREIERNTIVKREPAAPKEVQQDRGGLPSFVNDWSESLMTALCLVNPEEGQRRVLIEEAEDLDWEFEAQSQVGKGVEGNQAKGHSFSEAGWTLPSWLSAPSVFTGGGTNAASAASSAAPWSNGNARV